MHASDAIELTDYRRQVAAHYSRVRADGTGADGWLAWRRSRDGLFRHHPQSPIAPERRASYSGEFFTYDPAWRLEVDLEPLEPSDLALAHSAAGATPFVKFGTVTVAGNNLPVYWLDTYGGGIFLPLRDATNGAETYGGGRYLLDTVKGADLGTNEGRLVLDFNYAYHPSCVHDDRWSCPLASPESHLDVGVEAGELLPRPDGPQDR